MVSNGPQSEEQLPEGEQSGPVESKPVPADIPLAEPSDDYYEIRVVTRDAPVRVSYAAIRGLRAAIRSQEASTGLLRGTRSLDAISIEEFELLPSEANGVIDPKLTKLDQSVLGFFRTHANGWPDIQDSDRTIARECFPSGKGEGEGLFALIHNPGHRPWSAELFDLGQDGEFLTKDGAHEFYFDEYLLKNGYSTAPAEYNEPEEELEEPRGHVLSGRWIVPAALVIIILVGYGITRWDAVRNQTETLAHARMLAVSPLMLSARLIGRDYEITWNREAPVLEQANAASLIVMDEAVTKTFTLYREQWRAGRAIYTPLPLSPLSGKIRIRLEVEQGTRSQSESILMPGIREPAANPGDVSGYEGKVRTPDGTEVVALVDVAPPVARPSQFRDPQDKKQDLKPDKKPDIKQDTKPSPPFALVREPPKLNDAAKRALAATPPGSKVILSVRVIVDANGNVTAASLAPIGDNNTPIDAALQSAALDAARLWKYRPGMLNGKPVESESTITFNFQ